MVLPKFLYGTYKRYKADTTAFVDWVVETAKKCGHEATFQNASSGNTTRKGKKKSKAASDQPKHMIALKELSVLAYAVANSGSEIPPVILSTVKRAISLRKRCAKWFSSSKKEADSEPDTHSHFITVLEELCELLGRKTTEAESAGEEYATESTQPLPPDEANVLQGNQFSQLHLEEPEDDGRPATVGTSSNQIEIEEDDAEDDDIYSLMFFNLYCLFEDLHNMRTFVSQSVLEYVDGKIDLMNVAVIADTAVHLAKQLIDETIAAWPQLQKEEDAQNFLYVTACYSRSEHPEAKPDPTMPYNSNMADVAEWVYLPTTVMLTSF